MLRWTLGLVVVLESCQFIFSTSAAHFLAKAGLPFWIRPVLGGAEIIAAVLFLVPFTAMIGSYLCLSFLGSLLSCIFCMVSIKWEDWSFTPRPCSSAWPTRATEHPKQAMNDSEWMEAFERWTLPNETFHHADHVKMAFLYVQKFAPLEALGRFLRT